MRAALCYAFPLAPALLALWREQRNQFVRFHAAQAFVFFVTVGLTQVFLFLLVVVAGNLVGAAQTTLLLGMMVLCAYLLFSGWALVTWLRFVADCMAGRATLVPYFSEWALRVELLSRRLHTRLHRWQQARTTVASPPRKNSHV